MPQLFLIRHGQSVYNKKNIFTGWLDVDLSTTGIKEARRAGQLVKKTGVIFNHAYTSVLKRAIRTLWITLDQADQMWLPITTAWQLNERHYGALTGLNKKAMAKATSPEQVHIWRRSYDVRPPVQKTTDKFFVHWDSRYVGLAKNKMPRTESLADACARVIPYWHKNIEPRLLQGQNILISAHGNSLRGLIKYLDNIADKKISQLEIPTGEPLVYDLKIVKRQLKKVSSQYL